MFQLVPISVPSSQPQLRNTQFAPSNQMIPTARVVFSVYNSLTHPVLYVDLTFDTDDVDGIRGDVQPRASSPLRNGPLRMPSISLNRIAFIPLVIFHFSSRNMHFDHGWLSEHALELSLAVHPVSAYLPPTTRESSAADLAPSSYASCTSSSRP